MVDNKIQKEKDFHNQSFNQDENEEYLGRRKKFYSIDFNIRNTYQNLLLANSPNNTILEYGCGPGSYSFILAQNKAKKVIGIDISEVAIEKAKKTAQEKNLANNTEFIVMNAEELDFNNNYFDMICGTAILHHLDLEKSFKELSRVLKSGGRAIFIEPLGHNLFINLYRKLTPSMRTEDEHPLLQKDLDKIKKYFPNAKFQYFYLITLLAFPFRKLPGFKLLVKFLDILDKILFTVFPFLRKYAWQVIIQI